MRGNWVKDKVTGEYRPTLYPGEDTKEWEIPQSISGDFSKLSSIIESKYSKEYLKVCAFFNKMFPSLKSSDGYISSYNVPSFTAMDQERSDTGTGTNYNYLKQIVDQVTSRLGTISFIPRLQCEEETFEYLIYKDEVERVIRKFIKDDKLNRISVEAFHNAAILGYSHVFIDPFTGKIVKANDYEVGIYESQFNNGNVKQMLYRNYMFPVSDVFNYLLDTNNKQAKDLLESITGKSSVEFCLYFDCVVHKCYCTINRMTLPAIEYPFDNVLMCTFQWDTSFSKQLTSSLFDLLYPIQREINHIAAKKLQIIRMYKGSIPVFNNDVDIAMKEITNGAGEALYIDGSRMGTQLMTVINPTPLDPQLDAEITSHKVAMYELAGIQNASFDMENMRSAAAVVALDQTRDSVFQSQMMGMASFIKEMINLYIKYFVRYPNRAKSYNVEWSDISKLIDDSYIDMEPVHLNDLASDNRDEKTGNTDEVDYLGKATMRVVKKIIKGEIEFDTLPYWCELTEVLEQVAMLLIKFEALGVEIPDTLHKFLMACYIESVKIGNTSL